MIIEREGENERELRVIISASTCALLIANLAQSLSSHLNTRKLRAVGGEKRNRRKIAHAAKLHRLWSTRSLRKFMRLFSSTKTWHPLSPLNHITLICLQKIYVHYKNRGIKYCNVLTRRFKSENICKCVYVIYWTHFMSSWEISLNKKQIFILATKLNLVDTLTNPNVNIIYLQFVSIVRGHWTLEWGLYRRLEISFS